MTGVAERAWGRMGRKPPRSDGEEAAERRGRGRGAAKAGGAGKLREQTGSARGDHGLPPGARAELAHGRAQIPLDRRAAAPTARRQPRWWLPPRRRRERPPRAGRGRRGASGRRTPPAQPPARLQQFGPQRRVDDAWRQCPQRPVRLADLFPRGAPDRRFGLPGDGSSPCASSRTTSACSTSRAAATAAPSVRSPRRAVRRAPYNTPRTRRRTTTGTAITEHRPSVAYRHVVLVADLPGGGVVRHRAGPGRTRPPCRPGRCPRTRRGR